MSSLASSPLVDLAVPMSLASTPPQLQAILLFLFIVVASGLLAPSSASDYSRLHSVLLQLALVAGAPFLFSRAFELKFREVFKLRLPSGKDVLLTVLATVLLVPLLDEIDYSQSLMVRGSESFKLELAKLLRANSIQEYVWVLLSLAVVPSICEEILFRGFLLDRLMRVGGVWQAIMVTSILFGLFHRNLLLLLPAAIAGVVLGMMVAQTGTLVPAMLSHLLINCWATIAVNSSLSDFLPWTNEQRHVPWPILGICLTGLILVGRSFGKNTKTSRPFPP